MVNLRCKKSKLFLLKNRSNNKSNKIILKITLTIVIKYEDRSRTPKITKNEIFIISLNLINKGRPCCLNRSLRTLAHLIFQKYLSQ